MSWQPPAALADDGCGGEADGDGWAEDADGGGGAACGEGWTEDADGTPVPQAQAAITGNRTAAAVRSITGILAGTPNPR